MRAAVLLAILLAGCVARAPEPAGAKGVIVGFGDSYTEGYGARRSEAYPAILSRALGREVVNAGVTGETAEEGMARFEEDVLARDPELVIVEFGVNEAYRGHPVARAVAGIERIVERVENETDARCIVVGVHFWEYQTDFDEGLRAVAARHGCGLVLDVLDGVVSSRRDADDGDPALRADAFHPNAAGYRLMAERIRPEVERALTSGAARTV